MAELVDAPDLGSGDASHGGSSPFARTRRPPLNDRLTRTMQITETATDGLTHKYQITIGAADIDRRLASRYAEIAKTVRLPGFRPGKVPVSIVRQRFGNSVLSEVKIRAIARMQ